MNLHVGSTFSQFPLLKNFPFLLSYPFITYPSRPNLYGNSGVFWFLQGVRLVSLNSQGIFILPLLLAELLVYMSSSPFAQHLTQRAL